jgi:hypothetical protein
MVDDCFPQLPSQIFCLLAHEIDGGVEAGRVLTARVVHVLGEQVLQGLPHSVAFRHNLFASLVASAAAVGHERCTTDDRFQPLT